MSNIVFFSGNSMTAEHTSIRITAGIKRRVSCRRLLEKFTVCHFSGELLHTSALFTVKTCKSYMYIHSLMSNTKILERNVLKIKVYIHLLINGLNHDINVLMPVMKHFLLNSFLPCKWMYFNKEFLYLKCCEYLQKYYFFNIITLFHIK
jgi:hypothetical protein